MISLRDSIDELFIPLKDQEIPIDDHIMDVELTLRRNADNDNIEDELNEIDDIGGERKSSVCQTRARKK